MVGIKKSNADGHSTGRHCTGDKSMDTKDYSGNIILGIIEDTTADALKGEFIAGAIPREENFTDLIDLAEVGRKAVGVNGADDESGNGLALTSGVLGVQAAANAGIGVDAVGVAVIGGNGITVDANGVVVTPETNKGITVGANGVAVKPYHGIEVGADGVAVTPDTSKGIEVSSSGIAVTPGNGIGVSASGVAVTPDTSKGIEVSSSGVAVTPDNGIEVSASGVAVTPDTATGIKVTTSGVGINYGRGLTIESDQLVLLNRTTTGATFPGAPNVGDIHYRARGDVWEALPMGLNSGIDGSNVTTTGARCAAEGDNFITFFLNGLVSSSHDKGRTWVGMRASRVLTQGIDTEYTPFSVNHGMAVCGLFQEYGGAPGDLLISYNGGYSWKAIPRLTGASGSFYTAAVCGSRVFASSGSGCFVNNDFGITEFTADSLWNTAMANNVPLTMSVRNRFIFSAGANSNSAISNDGGITWTAGGATNTLDPLESTINSSGTIVISGSTVEKYTLCSTDGGQIWTQSADGLDPGNPSDVDPKCLASDGDSFFAAGTIAGVHSVYQSQDGMAWTLMTGIPASNNTFTGMAVTKDSFILVNNIGEAWGTYNTKYIYYDGGWQISS